MHPSTPSQRQPRRTLEEQNLKISMLEALGRKCWDKGCVNPAVLRLTVHRVDPAGERDGEDFVVMSCAKGHHRLKYMDSPAQYHLVHVEDLPGLGYNGIERAYRQMTTWQK